jgi:hypothetical protein
MSDPHNRIIVANDQTKSTFDSEQFIWLDLPDYLVLKWPNSSGILNGSGWCDGIHICCK